VLAILHERDGIERLAVSGGDLRPDLPAQAQFRQVIVTAKTASASRRRSACPSASGRLELESVTAR